MTRPPVHTPSSAKTNDAEGRALAALWLGALAPLVAWGLHVSLVSLFAPLLCEAEDPSALYGFTLLALAIDGAGGVIAWRCYRPTLGEPPTTEVKRRRYFGLVGMLGSVVFGVAIVAQALAVSRYAVC